MCEMTSCTKLHSLVTQALGLYNWTIFSAGITSTIPVLRSTLDDNVCPYIAQLVVHDVGGELVQRVSYRLRCTCGRAFFRFILCIRESASSATKDKIVLATYVRRKTRTSLVFGLHDIVFLPKHTL